MTDGEAHRTGEELPPPAPPRSALTLRLWVAGFGIVFNGVAAWLCFRADLGWLGWLLVVLVVVLVVDFAWVVHRKRRGDPG
ncbi:DUF6343 family protein [Saccharothrix longispora]|uniref:Cytochrome c-type biogenesis protein CcmH/NrfF n=1 Tax=Saccharothrix longispora TaxID=33920 RepID=A0ABU1PRH1_9PSEU|nr:DUF6343 family protein [Saccharothrix longispora]MDR6593238.1 cytochrome c-type biogenesis protein CcmH/NrfF [Saccharothrix longispora]